MQVGSFGEITFQVNDSKILTYEKKVLNKTATFSSQNVLNSKPVLTFMGTDLDRITLSVKVDLMNGYNPADVRAKLDKMMNSGKFAYLIMGDMPQANYPYVIEKYSMEEIAWDGKGNCILCVFDIDLVEYVTEA